MLYVSKLVFQFRKYKPKKTCNILKKYFIKSIFKNIKKKSIFLKLKQTHPYFIKDIKIHLCTIHIILSVRNNLFLNLYKTVYANK
jgi:hypothetical protein